MLKKKYSPAGRSCRVTFRVSNADQYESVAVLGEFNDWDPEEGEMKQKKSGDYETTISLKPGNDYRFRYLVNGSDWLNDNEADQFVDNEFGTQDSVISV